MAQERCNSQDTTVQAKSLSKAEVTAELLSVKLHEPVSVSLTCDSAATGSMVYTNIPFLLLKCFKFILKSIKPLQIVESCNDVLMTLQFFLFSIKRSIIYSLQSLSTFIY